MEEGKPQVGIHADLLKHKHVSIERNKGMPMEGEEKAM
jgi:hypothetical protein